MRVSWHVCNYPTLWFKRRGAIFVCGDCGKRYRLGMMEMGNQEYVRTWILDGRTEVDARRAA